MAARPVQLTPEAPAETPVFAIRIPVRLVGMLIAAIVLFVMGALSSWSVDDPSFSYATAKPVENWFGFAGSVTADMLFQLLGLAAIIALIPPALWSYNLLRRRTPKRMGLRVVSWVGTVLLASGILSCIATPATWPLPTGLGGLAGMVFTTLATNLAGEAPSGAAAILYGLILGAPFLGIAWLSLGLKTSMPETTRDETSSSDGAEPDSDRTGFFDVVIGGTVHAAYSARTAFRRAVDSHREQAARQRARMPEPEEQHDVEPSFEPAEEPPFERREPVLDTPNERIEYREEAEVYYDEQSEYVDVDEYESAEGYEDEPTSAPAAPVAPRMVEPSARIQGPAPRPTPGARQTREAQGSFLDNEGFELPELNLLAEPQNAGLLDEHRPERLEANARRLEGVLADFGVKGDIINVRPGPVVTLYELEPAPGIKSSRVISLADDIARSMSAISARVAVVPGRNAIGIELPNSEREMVFLREMLASSDFEKMKGKLNMCLGKTIGGEPVIADLARMPHLLVAGTTGSGKSVAINTMILSLLYKMPPEQCRLIMIDPKMLELSIYDGIPHLLSPVVTDPSKAVVALKWAVREMEDRYRKMSKVGVRNIDGFNARVQQAQKKGETISRTVQTGFDHETGEAIFESEEFDLEPLPYIVIIVDEMADLMMVAGKDIEGAIQRLAQMARAAGIHLIMATQRPSVDVITGTIKANFPTRISFQVTSKIDSRTILGEQGAETLLGMGDMLYMAGGGRTRRLHGPFVSDQEVEDVVAHLKAQGTPDYLESVTEETEDYSDPTSNLGNSGDELYDKAVNIVLNDKKASTSYIQRRLAIGYNRAATLIERMEQEGVISPANHAGKREILVGDGVD